MYNYQDEIDLWRDRTVEFMNSEGLAKLKIKALERELETLKQSVSDTTNQFEENKCE